MKDFEKTVSFLPQTIKNTLINLSEDVLNNISEIRLRKDRPVIIRVFDKNYYVDNNSNLSYKRLPDLQILNANDMEETFIRLCKYSVYSFLDDIKNGFITLENGNRVGFCGTAVTENGRIISIKKISSINIRIARQYLGSSQQIIDFLKNHDFGNVLLCGEPSSGKSTVLRDLSLNLSKMNFNVCVIDERQELFGTNNTYEVGDCLDVYCAYPKTLAIETAVRTMNPDYIITDEIVNEIECEAICKAINCGVNFAMSIHCNNFDELKRKEIFQRLENVKEFSCIVFMKGKNNAGKIEKIICKKDR